MYLLFVFTCITTIPLVSCQIATRPVNVWDRDGVTSTSRPPLDEIPEDEIIVPLNIGNLIGRRVILDKLFWTPDRDPREEREPNDEERFTWRPLKPENKVVIFNFLGIPYAEKPVSTRRFKPPQKLIKFPGDGIVRALSYRAVCGQDGTNRPFFHSAQPFCTTGCGQGGSDRPLKSQKYPYIIDEDCLYLNVFTPQIKTYSDHNYPVIVYFHGGGFQTGSANDWPAHVLASKGIVVVTANYRLGPFGFLSLGNNKTGNYGLQDQRLVLEWVRDHIYAFSGDNGRVTIVGHGAGGVSAGLHMLSKKSKGLFHGVSSMSGSDVSYHQIISDPKLAIKNAIKLGNRVGCTIGKKDDIWNCILTRSTYDIIKGASSMWIQFNRYAFLPTVDGSVIEGKPEEMLRDKNVASSVPYLIGINRNDGTEALLSDRTLIEKGWSINQDYMDRQVLDFVLKRNYSTNKHALVQSINYSYTYWPDTKSKERMREQFIEFASDAYYVAPVTLSARLHSESGSFTYMYVNNYNISRGRLNPNDQWIPYWMGVNHECDLYLLFGFPWLPKHLLPYHLRNVTWSNYDQNASETFMTMWKQFARKKNPNLPEQSTWRNYAPRHHYYLNFNFSLMELKRDYNWEKVAFWNEYLDNVALIYTTTALPIMSSLNKEMFGLKVTTITFSCLFLLVALLAGIIAYLLFESNRNNRQLLINDEDMYPVGQWTPPLREPNSMEMRWDRTKV